MTTSIREMQAALLNLLSEASSLANRLQRLCFHQAHTDQQASAWRKGLNCTLVPACMEVGTADAKEVLPGASRSAYGSSVSAG
mmetsp:Transcript_98658/g.307680  ORF Transcript_98658/g.307680 Transcript_98658/m.307680 type:complete len:83 (-) Transcript_98658:35-283(-)